jgi:dUTP pyrophosphatase
MATDIPSSRFAEVLGLTDDAGEGLLQRVERLERAVAQQQQSLSEARTSQRGEERKTSTAASGASAARLILPNSVLEKNMVFPPHADRIDAATLQQAHIVQLGLPRQRPLESERLTALKRDIRDGLRRNLQADGPHVLEITFNDPEDEDSQDASIRMVEWERQDLDDLFARISSAIPGVFSVFVTTEAAAWPDNFATSILTPFLDRGTVKTVTVLTGVPVDIHYHSKLYVFYAPFYSLDAAIRADIMSAKDIERVPVDVPELGLSAAEKARLRSFRAYVLERGMFDVVHAQSWFEGDLCILDALSRTEVHVKQEDLSMVFSHSLRQQQPEASLGITLPGDGSVAAADSSDTDVSRETPPASPVDPPQEAASVEEQAPLTPHAQPSKDSLRIHVLRGRVEDAIPARVDDGAAGWDLKYIPEEALPESKDASNASPLEAASQLSPQEQTTLKIDPGQEVLVPTGIAMALPRGTVGLIWPRSGLAVRAHLDTRAGVIDESYRGEVRVLLRNDGSMPFTIAPGDRIAQLLVQRYEVPRVEVVVSLEALGRSERGAGGFGSSGMA